VLFCRSRYICIVLNSGEHIDYIRSLCEASINAWFRLLADLVLKPVELIPVFRDSFPRRRCHGVREQDNREVLCGIRFSAALRRGVSISYNRRE